MTVLMPRVGSLWHCRVPLSRLSRICWVCCLSISPRCLQHSRHFSRSSRRLPHGLDVAEMWQQRARHPFRRFVAIALNALIPAFALAHDSPLFPISCGLEFLPFATAPMAPMVPMILAASDAD